MSDVVQVLVTFTLAVERAPRETDEEIEAYVHDAISDWFDEGFEYETRVVDDE